MSQESLFTEQELPVRRQRPNRGHMEDETQLVPEVIAENVVLQWWEHIDRNRGPLGARLTGYKDPAQRIAGVLDYFQDNERELINILADRADRCYRFNDSFARRMHAPGNKARDQLAAFMRGWLGAQLCRDSFQDVANAMPVSLKGWGR